MLCGFTTHFVRLCHPIQELSLREVARSMASFTRRQTIKHKVVPLHAKQRQLQAYSRSSGQGSARKFGQAPRCLVLHKSRKSVCWLVEDSLPACSISVSCSVSSVVVPRGLFRTRFHEDWTSSLPAIRACVSQLQGTSQEPQMKTCCLLDSARKKLAATTAVLKSARFASIVATYFSTSQRKSVLPRDLT